MKLLTTTALAAALLASSMAQPIMAQDATDQPTDTESGQAEDNMVVATVGETDITGADVVAGIDALPPQLQNQPADLLMQMVLDQLILRELILQQAQSENLAEDPEVQELAAENPQAASEDAMIQVWIDRELQDVVTDEAVQSAYDQVRQNTDQEIPPLDAVRPQIEQQLRQQEILTVRDRLMGEVEIVYYGPDGEPREASSAPSGSDTEAPTESDTEAPTESGTEAPSASGTEAPSDGGSDDAAPESDTDAGTDSDTGSQ